MLTKIWERYFLKEVLKVFLLFLFCFYGLYVLIDYAHHSRIFQHQQNYSPWKAFFFYYFYEFINRSEVLVPFAILLGTIRTLCRLNENNELIALRASGVKILALLRPFFLLGFFFTVLMYLNTQYLLPIASRELKSLDENHHKPKKQVHAFNVESVILDDNTTLLYQSHDPLNHLFFDTYWIRSLDEIYKIKYLHLYSSPPQGYFVEQIQRNAQGELVANVSEAFRIFPELKFNAKKLQEALIQPEDLSLSALWEQLPKEVTSEKEARLVSTFHRKLAMPWLCLLAVIAPAPFCMRFSRQFPVFLVYASSLFGLIAIYIVIDAAHVLGRRQLMNPLYALWTPIVLFALIFGWRYIRTK